MTSAIVGARPQMPCGGKNPRLNHAQTFMPLIQDSSYRAPSWLPGGHVQTIYPALFRRVARVTNRPERLELLDGDFVDLEWADQGRARLAILSHGLEADLQTGYIQGMAAALLRRGWDVLAWNFEAAAASRTACCGCITAARPGIYTRSSPTRWRTTRRTRSISSASASVEISR